ncbi:8628_t:CDS:2 [Dentiscutata erythropus]|uniref:8628_t:CDS:1 n=1 Tax=Dentiscutata erythropus TaxID=1348616 RepID=A0A9N9E9N0_9GLOM|nr:8628_t:CDS:2 [Dentiscutata erythropus]
MSLSQDEVYLVDDLRAIQDEKSFSDVTQIEWKPKKNVTWPLTPKKVIESSGEKNDPKHEDIEESSDNNYSSSQWETSDNNEFQVEVVIRIEQEDFMMDEFIKWPEDDQEETSEPQVIDISTDRIGKTQLFENEFFFYNHPTLNNHIAAWELNLRETVY